MLDRVTPPNFNTIDKIDIVQASKTQLENGIPVYSIDSGSQELVKIEFIFKAGMYFQDFPLLASSTSNMMENGTTNYDSEQLSEHLDFYGSYFQTEVGQDFASISFYSLNKHLKDSIYFVEDILKNANFPQHEFETFISNKKQRSIINAKKVAVIARRRFSELICGEQHPYGKNVKMEDFDKIKREDLLKFYHSNYNSVNCTILVAGKLPANIFSVINDHFGKENWGGDKLITKENIPISTSKQNKHFILKEDAIQSAIRIGRPFFTKGNPDFFYFQILSTVLGGYFGSRLMSNIREDKGYTYGIGCGLGSTTNAGSFIISTEVGTDVTEKALIEIYKEINKLRTELISNEELQLVKNYILGIILRSVDGPFALAGKFKGIWKFGLTYEYYDQFFNAVQNVTAEDLKNIANKYLKEEDLIELVVGKK